MMGLSGLLQNKYKPGSREAEEWINQFPDSRGDETCTCGLCDGYGMIIDEQGARFCPNALGIDSAKPVRLEYMMLNEMLKGWEGWPTPSFEQMEKSPSFRQTTAWMACKSLHKEGVQARIFCGANGRGKTLSCMQFLAEHARRGNICFAFRFPDLIRAYKRGIDGNDELDWHWKMIKKSKAVLVDEFGREALTGSADHTRQAIDQITNLCYRQRILLVTSNLSKEEIENSPAIGSNVQSRIKASAGWCRVFEDNGQDLRGSKL